MAKTTVYLDDRDAAALRRLAAESGRSQAEIIREAIARTTQAAGPRRLRSAGVGRSSGEPVALSEPIGLYEERSGHVLPPPLVGAAHRAQRE